MFSKIPSIYVMYISDLSKEGALQKQSDLVVSSCLKKWCIVLYSGRLATPTSHNPSAGRNLLLDELERQSALFFAKFIQFKLTYLVKAWKLLQQGRLANWKTLTHHSCIFYLQTGGPITKPVGNSEHYRVDKFVASRVLGRTYPELWLCSSQLWEATTKFLP